VQWADVEAVVTSYVRLPGLPLQARDFKPDIPNVDSLLFNRDMKTIKPSLLLEAAQVWYNTLIPTKT
jgi:hypothetical protein